MIVAVDGPAASGKGTIARRIAGHYGLPHLDTGLLYRAVGMAVLEAGGDPAEPADALEAARHLVSALDNPGLKSEAAGKAASIVSAHRAVRAELLNRQRRFADQPGGAVLDGRDIGTVIAPWAHVKMFVTADPAVRAGRRHRELVAMGIAVDYDHVLADIRARDERDSSRSAAPLRVAEGAHLLDTSNMGVDEAVAAALALVEQAK